MKGSCLCGKVSYEVEPPFKLFQYCHCTRCRKITGSAHASNLFVAPSQFHWVSGEELVSRFELSEAKYFASSFCRCCGSALPWQAKGVANLVIPAGSLDEDPKLRPKHNIYVSEKACWYTAPDSLPEYETLPPRKPK